jgi:16S rRNA (adenine1518-N6/adenine1519-N6)-dimethyltransferase
MTFHDPRAVLKAHKLWTKKHFGQNFLIDPAIPQRVVQSGGAGQEDTVFEIGAGCGTLTRALAPVAGRVIALEYDRDLVPVARAETAWADNVEVREGNVLDVDWPALASEAGGPLLVYGNLPYHLSTQIVLGLLEHHTSWRRACFMLQKEFAERLAAEPGTRAAGALSVQTALWAVTTVIFQVPPGCFHPPPKVDSAVIVMERRSQPAVDVGDAKNFRTIVRALFAQRRKMARKALKSVSPNADAILEQAGLDGRRRGETFTLDEIGALSRAFSTAT